MTHTQPVVITRLQSLGKSGCQIEGKEEGWHQSDTQTQSEDRRAATSYAKDKYEMQRAIVVTDLRLHKKS